MYEDPMDDTPSAEMTENELLSHLQGHSTNALGYHEDAIAAEQSLAMDYYYGRMPDLPHEEGTSSVVDSTVQITIDNALSAILRPFVSSDEVVSFMPREQEDVEFAEQATDYCNYVINEENPGFLIFHSWFKDALLQKIGIVKCWWEENERIVRKDVIVQDPIMLTQVREDPSYMGEQQIDQFTWQVSFATPEMDGKVRIENVPPEEFLINPYARSLQEADYVAHKPSNVTRSDLIEMGFDPEIVESLTGPQNRSFATASESSRRQARYQDEQQAGTDFQLGNPHKSQELVEIYDEYVRIDYDGDGIAELRRCIRSGDKLLLNEEVECHPFAALCPIPMPHKFVGRSMADEVVQIQKINTAIWRQTLDNLYKTNNPRPVIGQMAERPDGATQSSLASHLPGAAILAKDISQLRYESVPFFARESFTMLEYNRGEAEERSGVSRKGQGLDEDALQGNMTATQASLINEGIQARTEMIARIFAETGVRDLFKLVLKLLVKYQPKAKLIRLRNDWVEMNPQDWPADMDVSVSVGLGMGNKREKLVVADAILNDIERVALSPYASIVTPNSVYNALKMKLEAADVKNVDDFYTEPDEEMMANQQEKPDPELVKVQSEMALKQQQQEFEQMLAEQKAIFEATLAYDKAEAEAALAQWKAQQEARLKGMVDLSNNRPGGDLSK